MQIITDDRAIDGVTLATRIDRAAGALAARGVGAGDCVAILLRNDIAFIEASLACRRLGAYCVPVNWHFSAEEILYVVADCGARLLVAHADLLARVADALPCPAIVVPVPPAREARLDKGDVVAQQDRDAIARPDPARGERSRGAVDALAQHRAVDGPVVGNDLQRPAPTNNRAPHR